MSESQADSSRPRRPELPTIAEDSQSLLPGRTGIAPRRGVVTLLSGPERGMFFRIPRDGLTLGRSEESSVILPDPGLSRIHAKVYEATSGSYVVEDCGSTNGTFLDQVRIERPEPLQEGALIGLGRRTVLKFTMQDPLEERALREMYEAATRDRLTGAYNRGVFDERLASEFAFARRHKTHLALLLFDVDHFKRVNDEHGHPTGDAVLAGIARVVKKSVRTEDLFARYGGEEFGIIARESAEPNARILGERVRHAVSTLRFPTREGELQVSVSVGVACMGPEAPYETPKKLVAAADDALYTAKEAGRDRVFVYSPRAES